MFKSATEDGHNSLTDKVVRYFSCSRYRCPCIKSYFLLSADSSFSSDHLSGESGRASCREELGNVHNETWLEPVSKQIITVII